MNDLYHEDLLEEARQPQCYGVLDSADQIHQERNASCGDEITVYLKLDPQTHQITEISWQGTGCIISQVSMSKLAGLINDKKLTLDEVKALQVEDLLQLLGLEIISPGRLRCLMLGRRAVIQETQET